MLSGRGILLLAMSIGSLCEPLPRNLIPGRAASNVVATPVSAADPPSPEKRDMAMTPSSSTLPTIAPASPTTLNALSVLNAALWKNDTTGGSGAATSTKSDYPAGAALGEADKAVATPQPGGTSATTLTPTIATEDTATSSYVATPTKPNGGMSANIDLPKPVQYMDAGANHNIPTTVITTTYTITNAPATTVPAFATGDRVPHVVTTTLTITPTPTPTETEIACSYDSVLHVGLDEIVDQEQHSCGPLTPTSPATSPSTSSSTSTPFTSGSTWIERGVTSTPNTSNTTATIPTTTTTTTPMPTTTTESQKGGLAGAVDAVTDGVVHVATEIKSAFEPKNTPKPSTAGAARLALAWKW